MPHFFNFDGLDHSLFILQNLCHGSRNYCMQEKLGRTLPRESPGASDEPLGKIAPATSIDRWYSYYGHLKSSVSETVIEAAVKLRMLQDFVRSDHDDIDICDMDRRAIDGNVLGIIEPEAEKLTLRECANKVIHATDAQLEWIKSESDGSPYEYWSGNYILSGTQGNIPS